MVSYKWAAAAVIASAPAVWGQAAWAHGDTPQTHAQGDKTCITSDGAPNHDMGRFPNRANPNAFREQDLTFCFPTEPKLAGTITRDLMTVGVTVTGVPIRPYTAGYYDPNGRRGVGRDPSSGWRVQAMHKPRSLGMDKHNAHVDRSGLYHYHGVADAVLDAGDGSLVGYAPDGFQIRYSPTTATSSWRLKSGERVTPPYGGHDGTYEEDFEYVGGAGTLDECNGAMVDGTYTYFATNSYPFFPRCFKGEIQGRFMTRN